MLESTHYKDQPFWLKRFFEAESIKQHPMPNGALGTSQVQEHISISMKIAHLTRG